MATVRKFSTKFSVSIPNADYINLTKKAQKLDVTLSKYVQDSINDRPALSEIDKSILIEMRNDLARVGANLNQIAHHLNLGLTVEHNAIKQTVQAVNDAVSRIKNML
jgi:hypothetical protein